MADAFDFFGKMSPHWMASYSGAFPITSSNSANTTYVTRAIYVGSAGRVQVDMKDGGANTAFLAVPAGTILPIRVYRVKTATTANNLVGLY